MTKSENRDVALIRMHIAVGNTDSAALGLSALIRSAMTKRSKQELLAVAAELNLTAHPEFII